MSNKQHVILIHGTWGNSEVWDEMAPEFERRGFTVHAPTLRHHELPYHVSESRVGNVSLLDYVADLSALVQSLDSPPLIVGHSLGGLIAQLLAARHAHSGLLLLAPAPAPGIFAAYPSTVSVFLWHFLQWGFWRKPLHRPTRRHWARNCVNELPRELQERRYRRLRPESGRVYAEMVLWYLDPRCAAHVDHDAIRGPVLVIGAARDRLVPVPVTRKTAARYRNALHVELARSGHVMNEGPHLRPTMDYVDRWLAQHGLMPAVARAQPSAEAVE